MSDQFTLYATALVHKNEMLQIWGQKDKGVVNLIEKHLQQYGDVFTRTPTPVIASILPNVKCVAFHATGKFYRATVVGMLENNIVSVFAIDSGFNFYVDVRNLRITTSSDALMAYPAQAEGFFLAGIATSPKTIMEAMKEDVVGQILNLQVTSDLGTNFRLARFYKGGQDVTSAWLLKNLVRNIPQRAQEELVMAMVLQRQPQQKVQQPAAVPPRYPPLTATPPANAVLQQPPVDSILKNPNLIKALAAEVSDQIVMNNEQPKFVVPNTPPPVPQQFNVIPVSSKAAYSVVITDIADGPWSFSVMLKSDIPLFNKLKSDLENVEKKPLKPPIAIGKPCVAYSSTKKCFCRGVVVGISHSSLRVSLIDYGSTEEVVLRHIFEPPLPIFSIHALAHNFSLVQLSKMKITSDEVPGLSKIFTEVVASEEYLQMQVTPTEENCMQNCDLYIGNQNVKILLNQRMQHMRRYVLETHPPIDEPAPAFVTHVESINRFYVQLRKREREIDLLSEELQAISRGQHYLKDSELRPGMPCLAQFLEDNQWYRGKIVSIAEDSVNVIFVDYGNDMSAPPTALKQIPAECVKRLPAQAHLCELAGSPQNDQEVLKNLLNLVNNDSVAIKVKSVGKNRLTVDVLKNGVDLISLSAPAKQSPPVHMNAVSPQPDFDKAPTQRQRTNDFPSQQRVGGDRQKPTNDEDEWNKTSPPQRFGGDRHKPKNEENSEWDNSSEQRHHRDSWRKRDTREEYDHRDRRSSFNQRHSGRNERFSNRGPRNQFSPEESGDGDRPKFGGKNFTREENGFGDGSRSGFGEKRFQRRDNEEGQGSRRDFGGKGFQNRDNDNNERGGGFGGGGGFKKFDDGGDTGNKFGARNTDRPPDDRPRRMPIRNEDRAPSGSHFTDPTFDPDTAVNGIVTFYVSPDSFFVQTQHDRTKFAELMENLQQEYVNKFSLRETDPLNEGDIVVAKFSEDRVLYRAEVITSDPLTVRFVDYGNFEEVRNRRDVYPVLRKLLDMPVQAMQCSLDGVKPAGESWSQDTARVFEQENLTFTVMSESDRIWKVKAYCGEQDLAQQLIAEGLALSTSEVEAAITSESVEKIVRIDCDLLPGELLLVDIPYVYSIDKFYAQFHCQSIENLQSIIMEQYADAETRTSLEVSAVAPSTLCIASTMDEPEVLYRAKVIQLVETGALVQFVDYGDLAEVPFSQIFEISEELASWPDLAIECSIQGDLSTISDETQDQFKTEVEGGQAIVQVHEVDRSCDNIRLKVTLYETSGKKLKVQDGINDSPAECGLPNLPLVGSIMDVNIHDFSTTSTVLLQLPAAEDVIMDEPEAGDVDPGKPCAVLCADGCWRRAIVTDGDAFLVDTGFIESVTDIRPLPPTMRGLPCALRTVAIKYPMLGPIKVSVRRQEEELVLEPAVKTGFISHVETASLVYFTPECVSAKLDEIQEAIAASVAESTEDEFIVAKFPDDDVWYRAQVIERDPLRVRFIDYGNATEVKEVAPMPADYAAVPPLATPINLSVELPESAKEQLEELIAAVETPLTLVEAEGKAVDFLLNGRSLIAQVKGQPELFPGSNVMVSHVVDANELYLQREVDTQVLTEIEERLVDVESMEAITPTAEDTFAAEFEDGAWYRARLQNDELYFVDFGNTAPLGEVKALPADLVGLPPMAIRVSLIPAENAEDPLQLHPGGPLVSELLNVPLRLVEVNSNDGVLSVKLSDVTPTNSRPRSSRPLTDQTDDDKSAGMPCNETDEEKRGKRQALVNVTDSDLEAAQSNEDAPHLEFELPDEDLPQATHLVAETAPTVSLPDDGLSRDGNGTRGLSDEDLIASGDIESASLSDEALLEREENLAVHESVPDEELLSSANADGSLAGIEEAPTVQDSVPDEQLLSSIIVQASISDEERLSSTMEQDLAVSTEDSIPDEDRLSAITEEESVAPVEEPEVTEAANSIQIESHDVSVKSILSDEALIERYEDLAQDAIEDSLSASSIEIAKSLGIEDGDEPEASCEIRESPNCNDDDNTQIGDSTEAELEENLRVGLSETEVEEKETGSGGTHVASESEAVKKETTAQTYEKQLTIDNSELTITENKEVLLEVIPQVAGINKGEILESEEPKSESMDVDVVGTNNEDKVTLSEELEGGPKSDGKAVNNLDELSDSERPECGKVLEDDKSQLKENSDTSLPHINGNASISPDTTIESKGAESVSTSEAKIIPTETTRVSDDAAATSADDAVSSATPKMKKKQKKKKNKH